MSGLWTYQVLREVAQGVSQSSALVGSCGIPSQVPDVGTDGEEYSLGLGKAHQGLPLASGEQCLACIVWSDLLEGFPLLLPSCH